MKSVVGITKKLGIELDCDYIPCWDCGDEIYYLEDDCDIDGDLIIFCEECLYFYESEEENK